MTGLNMLSEPLNRKCVYEHIFVRTQHVYHDPTCVLSDDICSYKQLRSLSSSLTWLQFTLFLAYSFSCHSWFVFALFILLPFLKTLSSPPRLPPVPFPIPSVSCPLAAAAGGDMTARRATATGGTNTRRARGARKAKRPVRTTMQTRRTRMPWHRDQRHLSVCLSGVGGGTNRDAEMFVSCPSISFSVRPDIHLSPPLPAFSPLVMKMNRFAGFALSTRLFEFSLFLSLFIWCCSTRWHGRSQLKLN